MTPLVGRVKPTRNFQFSTSAPHNETGVLPTLHLLLIIVLLFVYGTMAFSQTTTTQVSPVNQKTLLVFNPPSNFFENLKTLDKNGVISQNYQIDPYEADIWIFFLGGKSGIEFLPNFFFENGQSLVKFDGSPFKTLDISIRNKRKTVLISFSSLKSVDNLAELPCFVAGLTIQIANGRDLETLQSIEHEDKIFTDCKI